MFKILNGYENIDYNFFFEIKESKITRGHNYTLVKKQGRLDVRKYSFSQRTEFYTLHFACLLHILFTFFFIRFCVMYIVLYSTPFARLLHLYYL